MEPSLARARNEPIYIGREEVTPGDHMEFFLDRNRRLGFGTGSMVAFGIRVAAQGVIKLTSDFDIFEVSELTLMPPHAKDVVPPPFNKGDKDAPLEQAVKRMAQDAAVKLLEREKRHLADAWMSLADDAVIEHMSYRQYNVEKLAELGPDAPWKDRDFHEGQVGSAERAVASLDQEAYSRPWLHATRPGYVIICDGKLVDREKQPWDNRGTGWVQRHVFVHLSDAHSFADEMGRDDLKVERIRIVEGCPYVVAPDGLVTPDWSFEEPILTGTIIPGAH